MNDLTNSEQSNQKAVYIPPLDRLYLSVKETCEVLSCSRTTFYALRNNPETKLRTTKRGHKTLVCVDSIKEFKRAESAFSAPPIDSSADATRTGRAA